MFDTKTTIATFDPALWDAIHAEVQRQEDHIELIASENYASPCVLEAQGSVLTNKYAEGYPGKRYYGGCEHVDAAVFMALLEPGDTVLGMSLAHGGHLTHGAKVNFSGKTYHAV